MRWCLKGTIIFCELLLYICALLRTIAYVSQRKRASEENMKTVHAAYAYKAHINQKLTKQSYSTKPNAKLLLCIRCHDDVPCCI